MSVAVMDSLPELGGQVSALYPEKLIYDVGGFPAVKGQVLVDALAEQAATAKPTYLLGHRAEDLTCNAEHVTVTSHKGQQVIAKAVLITGGIGTFSPRPLPDAAEFENRGLRYFVPRLDDLAGLDVLIVGGGDSAFDWAENLAPRARSVTLIHRRKQFRAHEGTVQKVFSLGVRVMTPYEVAHIHGNESIDAVEVFDNQTNEREKLEVQAVVAALGFTADLGPVSHWGLEQRKRHILVDSAMRTNLPRVFAAGDIVDYDGKVKLISVGFGEAATAINNAAAVITPGAKVFPGHSSDVDHHPPPK
jgi:thioredoxin reductase (NADPH)